MATLNPFDLLGDDAEDLLVLASQQQKIEPKKTVLPSAKQPAQNKAAAQPKLPSKPAPPAQAVRDARSESGRGSRGAGRGYGRGRDAGPGSNRDFSSNEDSYGNRKVFSADGGQDLVDEKPSERVGGNNGYRGSFRGGRRGGFSNGDAGEEQDRPRRPFERRGGTGRGYEMKREGAGRGNWGGQTDELAQLTEEGINDEKNLNVEKPSGEEGAAENGEKETTKDDTEQKEPEDKEMTLEEYEKVLEEKRKALLTVKTEERKVDAKEFESMQQLSDKKANDEIFVKLGSEKDKKKVLAEKEERAKKSVSINEFLKPAEGERFYNPGGRGRGRGRGRGPRGGGYAGGSERNNVQAPIIEDPGQFPTLGGK